MKKSIVTTLLLLLCTLLSAGNVSQKEAQQKAASVFNPNTPMKLVATADGDQPAYYVFNAQRAEKGFVVVAAEDQVGEILGYSEHGDFDPQNMPPALRYMLKCYEQEITMLRNGQATAFKAPERAAIEPLVKTIWGQDIPYNIMVPMLPDSTDRCATGCVATAMAQIMKYWSSPKQTRTIPGYTTETNKVHMPALEPTTFNYDIMENQYNTTMGDAVDAVAKLMLYCGQAAKMDYDIESGAVVYGSYFSRYFNFNTNIRDEYRSNYSAEVWDEMMYDELEAQRPVLYTGAQYDLAGHAFVCDGYKDGLYHINWGWYGYYDGYFKLSECNPSGGGTGAGIGLDGYSFYQQAVIGIQPETVTMKNYQKTGGYIEALTVNSVEIGGKSKVGTVTTLTISITNNGNANVSDLYLFVGDSLATGTCVQIDPGETGEVLLHYRETQPGKFLLRLFDDRKWNAAGKTMPSGTELWSGDIDVVNRSEPNLKIQSFDVSNSEVDYDLRQYVIRGTSLQCEAVIKNLSSEDFEDELRAVLFKAEPGSNTGYSDDDTYQDVTIGAGKTETVTFDFNDLQIGYIYFVGLYAYNANGELFFMDQTYAYPTVEDTSGIQIVKMNIVDKDTPVFDLNGRRVGKLGDQLPKGLYVVKGKKFVVK